MATNAYGNGTTTATAGANTITHYYDRAGLKAATEVNIYGQWADRKSMPTKMGKTFKISKFLNIYDRTTDHPDFATLGYLSSRSYDELLANITDTTGNGAGLTEGAGATNKVKLQKVTFEASFARYGEMMDYTDEVELWSEDAMQVRYREALGALANRRQEDLIQLDMLSTTNVLYAGGGTENTMGELVEAADGSDDDIYRVSYNLIRKAARKLVRNRAEKNTSIVTGSTKIDTRTINKAFYAIVGPEVKYDLESLTRGTDDYVFIPAFKYAGASNLAEGEVGAMHDVRFIESESALVYRGKGTEVPKDYAGELSFTGAASGDDGTRGHFDVFPILFPTKGSFATVGLRGHGKIKFNSASPAKVSNENPYGTLGFFSYNFFYAGIILNETTLLKVNVLASR